MANVLGLFSKWPSVGFVKTRLARESSPEFACRVAEAFLDDSLERMAAVNARRVWAIDPPSAVTMARSRSGPRFEVVPQAIGDLGSRMRQFMADRFQEGAERVVLIGADSPTVPVEFIQQAFTWLRTSDVVIGPATDGGYYLLGCARGFPPIFEGIKWGSEDVLRQTIARLPISASLKLLPPWYDVDTLADWKTLVGHLSALRAAGNNPGAHHTEELAGGDRS
jgi:hypothetical protein